ncbi:MAG: Hpt domain-containing protein [Elusimicrobiales bacterium]|nr:Hpt domain-containing protein [Elusimicrobiales bacterium]
MEATNEFLSIFLEEAQLRIKDIEQAMEALKKGDYSAQEAIRISTHTLKGMFMQMGFDNTAKILKEIENLFTKLKNLNKNIPSNKIPIIEECISNIKISFEKIKNEGLEDKDFKESELKLIQIIESI